MKKILVMLLLVAALAAGTYLVKVNQETRRGATAAETSAQILPSTVSAEPGQEAKVQVWINTGKEEDKLNAAELRVSFDATRLEYIGFASKGGYDLINESTVATESGKLDIKVVSLGEEKGGAVVLAELNFKAVGSGDATVSVVEGKLMITGQEAMWDINTKDSGKVVVGGSAPTMVVMTGCRSDADCPADNVCSATPPEGCPSKVVNGIEMMVACATAPRCWPKSALTPAVSRLAKEGEMCGGIRGIACDVGLTCNYNGRVHYGQETMVDAGGIRMEKDASGTCVGAGKTCKVDTECAATEYCYQPPMPTCKPGMVCPQVMPPKVCKERSSGAKEGEACGGLRGIRCEVGLTCNYPISVGNTGGFASMPADQLGTCVREVTQCKSDTDCPAGNICSATPPEGCPIRIVNGMEERSACATAPRCWPKSGLTPVPRRVAKEGEMCGGIAGISCDVGLTCIYSTKIGSTGRFEPMIADQSGTCMKDVMVDGKCGARCYKDLDCGSGMVCAPIWWGCPDVTAAELQKLQTDQSLSGAMVTDLLRRCPIIKTYLPSDYRAGTDAKMPAFYGACRSKTCPYRKDCKCETGTPTPAPTSTSTPVPTTASTSKVDLIGMFINPTVNVGGEVMGVVRVESGEMRVSSVNTQIIYDTEYFDFIEAVPVSGATVMKNTVDRTTGKVTVYLTWSSPAVNLPICPNVFQFKLKAKKAGMGTMKFDGTYKSEVSGLNENGVSAGFFVNFSTNPVYQKVTISEVSKCSQCTSGLARSLGNANCDGVVNTTDFEFWRSEMFDQGGINNLEKTTWKSDFTCDSKVSAADFEVWRNTVFK